MIAATVALLAVAIAAARHVHIEIRYHRALNRLRILEQHALDHPDDQPSICPMCHNAEPDRHTCPECLGAGVV